MARLIIPCLFTVFCVSVAHAAEKAGRSILETEAIEICHRSGSLDCPPLPR